MIDDARLRRLSPDLFGSHATLKVRYRDLDTFKHVNNAVYPTYMEFGRQDYFYRFMKDLIDWEEKGFILGTNHIVHLHPLFLFDDVHIYTGVGAVGNRSVTFVNLITNQHGTVAAVGYSVLVAYNFKEGDSIPVPSEWRELFRRRDEKLLHFFSGT
ncbi:MAG: acyl-CoA thioesterase [Chlorobi bacterium]|nr:acyl-CoA thioesterase [Chlorobiota bacterium]